MTNFRTWMKGRKTYALAATLALATLTLVLAGHLTPTTALPLLMLAACGFPATFRSALKRHQDEELALLSQVAAIGAALAVHDLASARALGLAAAQGTAGLCQQLRTEAAEQPQPMETANT